MLKTFTDEHGNTISYQEDLSGEFIIRRSGENEISFPGAIIKRWLDEQQSDAAATLHAWVEWHKDEDETREANLWMIDELIKRHPEYRESLEKARLVEKARLGCQDGWYTYKHEEMTPSSPSHDLLLNAFCWIESPQGHQFWEEAHRELSKNV